MQPRIAIDKVSPGAIQALYGLEAYVQQSGIEHALLSLIKTRASQINGCAFCIDMHTKEARARGETEQRLYLLDAWRESPFYTDRERAALEWTEAVTLVNRDHVPDEVYARVCEQFTESELVNLTLAVVAINSWNRVCVSFRVTPGTFQVASQASAPSKA